LLNTKRLDEAIRITRFIRRLMTFFHPFNHRFSDIKRVKVSIALNCRFVLRFFPSED
jgi:large subunit ribosomal protein L17e